MTTLHDWADDGPEPFDPSPRAFAGQCARWLAASLTAIGLLWLLGFEAVLYHAAPLHARPDPILGDLRVLPSVAWLAAAAALVIRRTALHPPRPLSFWGAFAFFDVTVVMILLWIWDPPPLPLLAYHALVVAVVAVGLGAWLNASAVIGLPGREPDASTARPLLLGILVFAFVLAGSMGMLRGGAEGLEALAAKPPLSFTDDLDKVGSPHALFRDFNAMHGTLSPQAQVHPPGALWLVWATGLLTANSPLGIVLLLALLAATGVIPLYGWVARMASHRAALIAAMLYAVMPGVTLFATGSVDAAFAPITLTALYTFARALPGGRWLWAIAAGALFAVATLLHFALLTLAFWFLFVGVLHFTRENALIETLRAWVGLALGFAVVHALIFATTGFDYAEALRLAWASIPGHAADAPRAAWYWWPPLTTLALAFYAGIPVCLLSLRAVGSLPAPTRALARCGVLVFFCLALTFLGIGEGERAAYYAYPFLLLPAALMLDEAARRQQSLALPATAMALCAVQAWIMQSYFEV